MKKIIVFLAILGSINSHLYSQCDSIYKSDEIRVTIDNEQDFPLVDGNLITSNEELNMILSKYNVYKFEKVFPNSKIEQLQKLYKIKFSGNIDNLISDLKNETCITKITKRLEEKNISVYDPTDYMWTLTTDTSWLWHIKKIKADLAWDITKGSSNIKVAILDTWFDVTHSDLATKISPQYDPYDNTAFIADCHKENHGTAVASFVAAQTDGGGQLASVGFNCMIVGYQAWDGDYIERAHDAAFNMNADIITSSAGGWTCGVISDPSDSLALIEILDHGTIVVMPAGNGYYSTHCYYNGRFHAWKPLSPEYDERVIIVSSTDKNDYHQVIRNGVDITHSQFSEVDICATGYDLMGAGCTLSLDTTTGNCVTNAWPYYGSYGGTSFSTPIVAGVCALMKSVKPDITPSQAQNIIRTTADPIVDANLFPGLLGGGRINAYNSVCYVYNNYPLTLSNTIISGTNTYTRNQITISNTTFDTNSIVEIKTGELIINGPFEANSGGSLTVTNYTCP